ncbi:RagB/SusD family nutrient uptake outer membrane protein [Winogradskyella sp.]|uniref:RagB/SusD family nutrient uptake outer membrane protein n=1 Tax=Winogradskyella sp. TaxID=1883156 RepID=UPI0025EEDFB5|nr:RagB/SusD family nutrient uptake outer membrane protein [Winogradskyella sp.]
MKLKNIYKLLFVFVLLYGCNDEDIFQQDPDSTVIENFFQTEGEFELAMRGAMRTMKATGYYGGSGSSSDLIIVGDLLADNLIINPEGRTSNLQSHNWLYNDNTAPSILYNRAYSAVSRANVILQNLGNLPDGAFKDQIKAEALALRAAMHFDVARFYSKIPTQSADANGSLGIAYLEAFDPTAAPARLETVAEVYEKINTDLTEAVALIGAGSGETGRFDLNSIRGLISRVALHQGDYPRVIQFSQPVVTAVAPAPASGLASLWTSASSPGVLFELPFIVSDGLLDSNYSQGAGASIIVEYNVDKAFYDLYDQTTEPERTNAYFQIVNNWIVCNKYINGALQTGLNNGRYLRVEEVILNLAEAQYFTNPGSALATLDILRNARYSSFTGGETGDALFNAIMLERRKELAFESSDRWFTLKRLQGVSGIPAMHTQGVQRSGNGYLADGTGTVQAQLTLAAGNFKWQLPIQQSVIDENPNIEQNPDY